MHNPVKSSFLKVEPAEPRVALMHETQVSFSRPHPSPLRAATWPVRSALT